MSVFRFFSPGMKENWKVVVLSVVGAATFWFFNAMNKNYETSLEYPVSFSFNRDSVVVVQPLAERIKINVSSGGWNLIRRTLRINADPVEIVLENPTDIKFLTRSSITPVIKEQLSGLNVTYVVTDTLFFNIEEKISRRLPLIVDSMTIPLRNNYRIVSSIEIHDDSVWVTGPKSIILAMGPYVEVAFRDEEIDSDYEYDLAYHVDNMVQVEPRKTTVRFEVNRFLLKEVDVPIEFLNFPRDSSVVASQDEIRLYYTVNEDYAEDVSQTDFSVTVDYAMLNRRDSSVAPQLMYAHDRAIDIVLNVDKVRVHKVK